MFSVGLFFHLCIVRFRLRPRIPGRSCDVRPGRTGEGAAAAKIQYYINNVYV